jgi:peptidoglycan hydrolase CwlO-like protein
MKEEQKTEERKYQQKCNNMTLSFILLTQTVTGAVITIVALLLVAAIIGYFTAWYYAKSVYTPVIKSLEADKAELIRQVAGLKEEVSNLNATVDKLKENVSKLEEESVEKNKEIKGLKEELAEKDKTINELNKTNK